MYTYCDELLEDFLLFFVALELDPVDFVDLPVAR